MKTYIERKVIDDYITQLILSDEAGRTITLTARPKSGWAPLESIYCSVSGEFSVGEWEIPKEDLEWLLGLVRF